ncbi:MAG: MATE family efflux transporter, partial [Pygmaiobacter sp.]
MEYIKRNFLLEKVFFRTAFAIVLPIAAQNVISFGVNAMDSIMLGSLGDIAISAANLGGQPFFLLMGFGFGLSSGGGVLIAQYWGKKDLVRIRKVMRMSMQFVFVMSVLATLLCTLMPEAIIGLFTTNAEIIAAASSYLRLVAFSYIPYSISNNYIMSLRAVEQVKISAAIYGVSFFVNVFFNYCFIFGKFGFPALGVRGAAVGTILARTTELILAMLYMHLFEKRVGFRIKDCLIIDTELLPDYVRHSLPVVGNELMWSFG